MLVSVLSPSLSLAMNESYETGQKQAKTVPEGHSMGKGLGVSA